MKEFLSYDILGLITVQTYLIIALIDLIIRAAFSEKNKPFSKQAAQALFWPIKYTIIAALFVIGVVVALLALTSKVFK